MKKIFWSVTIFAVLPCMAHAEFYNMHKPKKEAKVESQQPNRLVHNLSPEQAQFIENAQQDRIKLLKKQAQSTPANQALIFINDGSLNHTREVELMIKQLKTMGSEVQAVYSVPGIQFKDALKKISANSNGSVQWQIDAKAEMADSYGVSRYPAAALMYKGKKVVLKNWTALAEAIRKIGNVSTPKGKQVNLPKDYMNSNAIKANHGKLDQLGNSQ